MKQLIYICILLGFFSCTRVEKSTNVNKAVVEKEVVQMLSDYHDAISKEGLTAEFAYLDQSADFFWVPPGYTSALDYDSVRAILVRNAVSLKQVDFHWDTLQIFPLSNEIANYTGIVKGEMTDTSGVASQISIIESGTLIKRKGAWKLLSGQSAVLVD